MIRHLTAICSVLALSSAVAWSQAETTTPAPPAAATPAPSATPVAPPAVASPPAPPAVAPAWKEYVYRDDGFAISSTVAPTLEKRPIYVVGGTADAHIYTTLVGDEGIFIVFVFERAQKDRRSETKVKDDAQKDALSAVNGKLKSRSTVALGRFRGVELDFDAEHPEFDMKKQRVRDRLYVVGRKLYHLMAIAPVGSKFPEDTDKWFKSFRLTTADDDDDDE